jgi:magnesium-transporting ATPase (P-type)
MATDTTTRSAPPEQIRAVPVRHPGRWVAAAVIAVLVAMFVHMLVTNPAFQWRFMVDNMFTPAVLRGARTTLVMTVLAMLLGVLVMTGGVAWPGWLKAVLLVLALLVAIAGWLLTFRDLTPSRRR